MTDDFFGESGENIRALNQEIEELYREVEDLHQETGMLLGLMSGSYAYFLQQLMLKHQAQEPLTPENCEKIVVDSLKRILITQNRYDYDFLAEIQAALSKMSQPTPFEDYLKQARAKIQ